MENAAPPGTLTLSHDLRWSLTTDPADPAVWTLAQYRANAPDPEGSIELTAEDLPHVRTWLRGVLRAAEWPSDREFAGAGILQMIPRPRPELYLERLSAGRGRFGPGYSLSRDASDRPGVYQRLCLYEPDIRLIVNWLSAWSETLHGEDSQNWLVEERPPRTPDERAAEEDQDGIDGPLAEIEDGATDLRAELAAEITLEKEGLSPNWEEIIGDVPAVVVDPEDAHTTSKTLFQTRDRYLEIHQAVFAGPFTLVLRLVGLRREPDYRQLSTELLTLWSSLHLMLPTIWQLKHSGVRVYEHSLAYADSLLNAIASLQALLVETAAAGGPANGRDVLLTNYKAAYADLEVWAEMTRAHARSLM